MEKWSWDTRGWGWGAGVRVGEEGGRVEEGNVRTRCRETGCWRMERMVSNTVCRIWHYSTHKTTLKKCAILVSEWHTDPLFKLQLPTFPDISIPFFCSLSCFPCIFSLTNLIHSHILFYSAFSLVANGTFNSKILSGISCNFCLNWQHKYCGATFFSLSLFNDFFLSHHVCCVVHPDLLI